MSNFFFQTKVGYAAFLNYISVFHGFLHSSLDQKFYQLFRYLYGFIGSMISPNLEAVQWLE
jgi:hypothetical protein